MIDDTADFLHEMGYGRTCEAWDGRTNENPVWCCEPAVCKFFGVDTVLLLCEGHRTIVAEVLSDNKCISALIKPL